MAVNNYYDTRDQKSGEIVFPFGPASQNSIDFAAAIELNLYNTKSIVTVGQLTGVTTITSVPSKDIFVGSELTLVLTADGSSRNVTFGTGFQVDVATYVGGVVAVAANKTVKAYFEYDGTAFVLKSVIGID